MAVARVEYTMTIENGVTDIVVRGGRDAAVVVRSEAGERIYLPPEGFDASRETDTRSQLSIDADGSHQSSRHSDTPYQSVRDADSPYQSVRDADSPYQSVRDADSPYQSARNGSVEVGLRPTSDGFHIHHPEPVTDLRILR
ncbi:MAG: DUF7510 family protein [Halobacteriota archaeon]